MANDITAKDAGFGSDTNRVTLIDAAGTPSRCRWPPSADWPIASSTGWSQAARVVVRVLVVSDIHANDTALQAVIQGSGRGG